MIIRFDEKISLKKIYNTLILFLFVSGILFSQTKSKIEGSIVDAETGEQLFGANVVLVGTTLGAASDINGKYFIINSRYAKYVKILEKVLSFREKN